MTRSYLLDASALLAFMAQEPGGERVRAVILDGDAAMSAANLAEAAAKLVSRGMAPAAAEGLCRSMGIQILPLDEEVAFGAAALVAQTQHLGLSLGDRVCLATAAREGMTALTADREWAEVPSVRIEIIR